MRSTVRVSVPNHGNYPVIRMRNTLRRLDINLLVTLDALLAEHNVTRAAERLHLSQPSVSIQLAKLREALGDPLLIAGPRGMRPTARAEELREPLSQALDAMERALAPAAAFDPAKASQTWRVAASGYSETTILHPALPTLRDAAPGCRLAVVQMVPTRLAHELEEGRIDLAFQSGDDSPSGLRKRYLFHETWALVGRKGHPGLARKPSLTQFCKLDHAIVSLNGGEFQGITDRALAKRGRSRRVVLSVPHFLFLKNVLATTDLVAVIPTRLARSDDNLKVVEPPLPLPKIEVLMVWHERSHRDPAHRWLREHIAASATA